jgi:hypothetical protein
MEAYSLVDSIHPILMFSSLTHSIGMLSLGTLDMVIGDSPVMLIMQLFTTLPKSHSLTLYTLERNEYNLMKNQQLMLI